MIEAFIYAWKKSLTYQVQLKLKFKFKFKRLFDTQKKNTYQSLINKTELQYRARVAQIS